MLPPAGLRQPFADVLGIGGEPVRLRHDPIDDAVIGACLDAAAWAMAPGDRCEFVVLRDPDRKHQIARIYRQGWSIYKRVLARQGAVLGPRQWEADHFEDVPVVIVGCAKGRRPAFPAIGTAHYYGAVLPPLQNLVLTARALGLAARLSSLAVWSAWQTRRTLELPRLVNPVAVVTLGWPLDPIAPATRRDRGFAVLDRHGQPFPESNESV